LVDVVRFFSEHIVQDLQGASTAVHPIIQADAIKFLYTFRSQLSKDQLLAVLPLLIPKLESDNFVIHTYAATTIERCLFIKREGKYMCVVRRNLPGEC
jgi:exportin-2 (importin alpha re-exporter)